MAYNRTFTITQPFLGAPLQFNPALGSKELEELIDSYVVGSASKQDKLSEVTIEFYNHATVDLNTGALFRQYNVVVSPWTFEQSPVQSQSSSFSPDSIFTPSPASSATFADSGYGSISMTPPTRMRDDRVAKKPKKDTKKVAEARLPGFSIMTKDGIDVTSSAGRGTKTKEQREHAHLMRIMKACSECKKKKVRCDPSHRRQNTEMSRTSTSTTKSSPSSSRPKTSPPVSVPSLSRHTTEDSPPNSLPSFGTNTIDDFVLFPEDNTSSWNPADMSIPEFEDYDLGQFNFDINDIGQSDFPNMNNQAQSFDFSSFEPSPASFQIDSALGHNPHQSDQYGLDQWASPLGDDMTVIHTRPHPSTASHDSGQPVSSWFDSGSQATESPRSQDTTSSTENYWSDGLVTQPQIPQGSSIPYTSSTSPALDWSLLESSVLPTSEEQNSGPSLVNRRQRRSLPNVERARNAAIQELVDAVPSRHAGASQLIVDPSDQQSSSAGSFSKPLTDGWYDTGLDQSSGASSGGFLESLALDKANSLIQESMQALKSAPAAYQPIYEELQRLRNLLIIVKSGPADTLTLLQQSVMSQLETLTSQLQVLLSRIKVMLRRSRLSHQRYNRLDPEARQEYHRQCQVKARRLIRSLCATITNLQVQDSGIGGSVPATNTQVLTSGRNLQLASTIFNSQRLIHPKDAGDSSLSWSSDSSTDFRGTTLNHNVILRGDGRGTLVRVDDDSFEGVPSIATLNGSGAVSVAASRKLPRDSLVMKPQFERLSRLVDGPLDLIIEPVLPQTAQDATINIAQTVQSILQTHPTILSTTQLGGIFQSIASSSPNMTLARNVGCPRSASLPEYSGVSFPGAIPGTVLANNGIWYNDGALQATTRFSLVCSYICMLASLFFLSYLPANPSIIPLAALFLAIPRPTPTLVATLSCCYAVAQSSLAFANVASGAQALITVAMMCASLFRKPVTNGSFDGLMRISRKQTSNYIATRRDSSLLGLFDQLTLNANIMIR